MAELWEQGINVDDDNEPLPENIGARSLPAPTGTWTDKTGPLERNTMSVCHQSKMDKDTFFASYTSLDRWKAHFPGFLMVSQSCVLVGLLGCSGQSKLMYQKVTIS